MGKKFFSVLIIMILIAFVSGCTSHKTFDEFSIGMTLKEGKDKLAQYPFVIRDNLDITTMEIDNYMKLYEKDVVLRVNFTNSIAFDQQTDEKQLDDFRLLLYNYSVENVDEAYAKKVLDGLVQEYGEPKRNDFLSMENDDKVYKDVYWDLEDYELMMNYEYPKDGKNYVYIRFVINDNGRQKYKKYIREG
ncbi:hypothetical protein EJP77_18625 [Paenibacillus zeisoli]|uniref:Lipoprotein n=1 Tax=Paenibacillus zeisoli TaxID=2496267 RepID=A0A3S1JL78_9BACL|nr:hypothetical protein [Paenibacillus zeisoli]RUT28032.1 hypothetical protein EJP77_18625 [Paenibacillus zeisoli]